MKVTRQDMRWTNEPEKWKQKEDDIKVTCPMETDYWRHTMHNFVKDDAPFYWMYVDYDFEVRMSVKAKLEWLYDQAGMMIRLNEENWVKLGIVQYRDFPHVSTCFTRGKSDWSMQKLPRKKVKWIHFWAKRKGNVIECYYSLDNENWLRVRQGHFSDAPRLRVGMMCAAPESAGFDVTFSNFLIKGDVDDSDEDEEEEEGSSDEYEED